MVRYRWTDFARLFGIEISVSLVVAALYIWRLGGVFNSLDFYTICPIASIRISYALLFFFFYEK